ncbi:MAG: hypothetical protein ABIQ89_00210 [Candidatus Saccharimonadales bacterium]
MSEVPKNQEHFTAPKGGEQQEAVHHKANPEHEPRHEKKELAPVPELASKAKEEAVVGKELVSHEKSAPEPSQLYVNKELKQQTWNRTMTRVRKHLSTPNRAFSKVIHQPVVDAASRVGEKTVARPSGLLMGSIFAFLGSCFFLWMSKHYGFRYNYLVFFLLFVGGFGLGIVVEMLAYIVRRKKV